MAPFTHQRHLGDGFFGRVELEYDQGLNRFCAAKYIENNAFTLNDFAEAQSMELGKNDNVVRVYSMAIEHGTPVIRMEYLEGGSVADKHGREAVPVREALQIMEAACRGVEHIHGVGLLHRDIKPSNLLLHPLHTVKVSDFGLACNVTDVGDAVSIPYLAHLPPEAIADGTKAITAVTGDVYALALTTYRLLNSDRRVRPKLDAGSPAPARKDWMPYIHKSLRTAVTKGLNPSPDKRTPSALQFRYALEKARPVVSWHVMPVDKQSPGELNVWQGTALGGTEWRARMTQTSPTSIWFNVERRLPGRSWRAQNRYKLNTTTVGEMQEAAAEALQHIASTGS